MRVTSAIKNEEGWGLRQVMGVLISHGAGGGIDEGGGEA